MPRIVILGDSHTQALKLAAAGKHGVEVHWLLREKVNKSRGSLPFETAMALVANLAADDLLAVTLAGGYHNRFGLLEHQRPFDIEPGVAGREIIPQRVMWTALLGYNQRTKRVRKLRRAAKCLMVHLATPPPHNDIEAILRRVGDYRGKPLKANGVAPAALRLKLWALEMRVVKHLCNEWQMGFVPPPEQALQPDGFMKVEYHADDTLHANKAYGELVLQQLLSY